MIQNSATVYRSVINDVIENVKKDFEDSGVDESVLRMLQDTWEQKIKGLRVTTWDQGDNTGNMEGLSHNGNLGTSVMPTSYSQPPPNDSHPKAPSFDYEAANLPTLASSTININDFNGMGKPQPHLSPMKNGNSNTMSSTPSTNDPQAQVLYTLGSHLDVLSKVSLQHLPQNDTSVGHDPTYHQPIKQQEVDVVYSDQLKIKDDRLVYSEAHMKAPTPPPQHSAYDSSRKETRRNELYGEEDDINSDLDDSDDEGNTEGEETQNIILCLYDKVTRTKNKWKCQLKDGIMSVNGRDYLFQKGNGDFEF
ncbi:transcription factor IIA, alpha/beta subunit-domain-containing protein [Gigaspora rosea]|uniref:Transcription factor IIA, alpha/beta subunit-domain-containing protein n=1 Tax=Gigaspora rosea TaxID=44941 RepID=A0A397V4X2_9GLOM|nr:transcription factor IIA, alpha/beta subunit-domain-containing protein [Gigaspora rosea]